ncbi:hypothetical protein OG568_21105 [Streptomyces sp. NBC_01450]|uniref:hypothetical protein n=1 Tax=Streptomyces sp. NBC_01450 TaxID=2903871 RepID=UPI002E3331A6|nr:hypothetical protein [Streptomyces sp. NBC_01450]
MTTHAMTLPGNGLSHRGGCRGTGCEVVIRAEDVLAGDTLDAWHAAIKVGSTAMDAYLATYNARFAGAHAVTCEFSTLPPIVHVAYHHSYDSLEAELELANSMRYNQ